MGFHSAIELLEDLIIDLEGKLNLGECRRLLRWGWYVVLSKCNVLTSAANYIIRIAPDEDPVVDNYILKKQPTNKQQNDKKQKSKPAHEQKAPASDPDLPDICKLEFKVGRIDKVWTHPDADKLYCEEIDCGEEGGPRQIASGLRPHYSEEDMLGKKVLVVANLKVRS